jgi:hypothetical protein
VQICVSPSPDLRDRGPVVQRKIQVPLSAHEVAQFRTSTGRPATLTEVVLCACTEFVEGSSGIMSQNRPGSF